MNHYLLQSIEFGPVVLERIIAQVPAGEFDRRLDPERFSLREAAAHLADWEPILRGRIEKLIEEPGSDITPRDEGQMAIDNRYSEQDISASLHRLKAERAKTAALLRTLNEVDWNHTGLHPEAGAMSVYDIAHMIQGHDLYHIEQASAYLT